ncbi:glycosyltransferase family 28 domain-containing protein [Diplogelasinospora grovesii]|uniref:Glycosyltransferase family 28 domain-containing protein n=1 Tax=Diplogelasinospora grovesii TaxID=303347 RepID=A0AAN6NIZ7_9PEZI|nr:glycosyltransferase family 28 domain-containing protein [Diplogelasinospora grovesii]
MATSDDAASSVATAGGGGGGDTPAVHLESIAVHRGHQVHVVRDDEGHTVYPAFVPPETTSPTTQTSRPAPSTSALPRKVTTDPSSSKSPTRPSAAVGRRWATEMPTARQGANLRSTTLSPPAMRRAGTNVSQLDQALWGYPGGESSSSSSDSSSDEEEEQRRHHMRQGGRGRARGKTNDDNYGRFRVGNENYNTKGRVKKDGRLNISVKDTSNKGYLAKALGTAVRKVVAGGDETTGRPGGLSRLSSASTTGGPDTFSCPTLNIVIMVIGSRGDAQPFLKVGKVLKEQYGHRVRIATHPAFRDFVEKDSGLEFFSVGGDPSELMAFMVKNPGMIPTLETVKAGDIGRRRAAMAEMFGGFWRACINATDDEKDTHNLKMMGEKDPFVADAIIANPPSFAHIHCAEALGIPLHLMFTFPYTPTQAFPHPLASIKKSNVDPGYTNFISYPLVEMMVWQGLGDLVNDFRVKTLGLDPVSTLWAPGATYRLHVPVTYLWSPGLVPKPEDWGDEVDVSGFVFLDLASSFKPPDPLTKFLEAGEEPVYIGFGSIVVDDADRFTQMIFEAVQMAGVRALVYKGWGGLGGDSLDVPENIFMLDNTPHDWLFPKVRACVIHGGAGTTAIALKCGKPTMVVPFFGDQYFWGSMLSNAKAGPEPVPYKHLTAEKLTEGIKYCITEEAAKAAKELARDIEREGDGAENACRAFHKHLALSGKNSMRCSILAERVAVWQLKETNLRLSAVAAELIVERGSVSWRKLRLLRHNEWNDFEGPGEPVTGVAGSLLNLVGDVFSGIGGVPYRLGKSAKKRKERREKKKKAREERKAAAAAAASVGKEKASESKATNGNGNGNGNSTSQSSTSAPQPTQAADHATHAQETISPNSSAGQNDDDNEQHGEEETTQVQTTTTNAIRRTNTGLTQMTSTTAGETDNNPAEEFVINVGKGAFKSVSALVRAPVDLSLALAQGFHNAPRLYGDDTVRRPTRVTGIKSGLKAARREFVYGIYDGWTGLVRLPYRGAKNGGPRGFITGVGMGVTGFILKDLSALFGPAAYTLKGVVKQADRSRQPIKYIRRARIVQGQRELRQLNSDEKRVVLVKRVVHGWEVMRALWVALEAEEKMKGGLRAKFSRRKKRSLGAAFESVEIAEKVLAALKRGESIETVVGDEKGRTTDDVGKSSTVNGKRKEVNGKQGDMNGFASGANGNGGGMGASGKGVVEGGMGGSAVETPPPDLTVDTTNVNNVVVGPAEEKENPFSASPTDIERNKEANRHTMEEALDGRA